MARGDSCRDRRRVGARRPFARRTRCAAIRPRPRRRGYPKRISAATFLEAAIVIDGSRDAVASRRLDDIVARSNLTIEPVTAEQAHIARAAHRDFGKGSGDPARLTFGDCFAYALAKATGEPLLFKGEDFGFTDIRPHR